MANRWSEISGLPNSIDSIKSNASRILSSVLSRKLFLHLHHRRVEFESSLGQLLHILLPYSTVHLILSGVFPGMFVSLSQSAFRRNESSNWMPITNTHEVDIRHARWNKWDTPSWLGRMYVCLRNMRTFVCIDWSGWSENVRTSMVPGLTHQWTPIPESQQDNEDELQNNCRNIKPERGWRGGNEALKRQTSKFNGHSLRWEFNSMQTCYVRKFEGKRC